MLSLLSNLQINIQQCISLNPQWSKAHVRLASAYIALGGHSNDACLSLQRALSLDRNNKVAREILVKEMRSRNDRERNGGESSSSNGREQGQGSHQEERTNDASSSSSAQSSSSQRSNNDYHPTDETPTNNQDYPNASAPSNTSESTNETASNNGINYDGIDVDDIDDPPDIHHHSLSHRIQYHVAQFITWFNSQSDDIKTLLKVGCLFFILYVMLGGRFGLDYALGGGRGGGQHHGVDNKNGNIGRRGNYEQGNAYDRYSPGGTDKYQDNTQHHAYERPQQQQQRQTQGSGYNDRSNPQNQRYYSRYGNSNGNYYEPPPRTRQRASTSWHMVRAKPLIDSSLQNPIPSC